MFWIVNKYPCFGLSINMLWVIKKCPFSGLSRDLEDRWARNIHALNYQKVYALNCQEILKLDEQKVSIFWTFKKFEDWW
jgi:hypothetical protein